jgi:hypothetical protein
VEQVEAALAEDQKKGALAVGAVCVRALGTDCYQRPTHRDIAHYARVDHNLIPLYMETLGRVASWLFPRDIRGDRLALHFAHRAEEWNSKMKDLRAMMEASLFDVAREIWGSAFRGQETVDVLAVGGRCRLSENLAARRIADLKKMGFSLVICKREPELDRIFAGNQVWADRLKGLSEEFGYTAVFVVGREMLAGVLLSRVPPSVSEIQAATEMPRSTVGERMDWVHRQAGRLLVPL